MTRYELMRKDCEGKGYIKTDELTDALVCGCNRDRLCEEGTCKTFEAYYADRPVGHHYGEAMQNAGISTKQYEEDMAIDEGTD